MPVDLVPYRSSALHSDVLRIWFRSLLQKTNASCQIKDETSSKFRVLNRIAVRQILYPLFRTDIST